VLDCEYGSVGCVLAQLLCGGVLHKQQQAVLCVLRITCKYHKAQNTPKQSCSSLSLIVLVVALVSDGWCWAAVDA
jgi:hypothetical protein